MAQRSASASFLFVCALLAGCVQIPTEELSSEITARELSAHVHFLAQPALEGRKPGSIGSWEARRYIESRFKACGLVPWGSEGYEQSFGLGTNVVGVLPGADENLAREMVLVCAHYDHIGRDKKGRVCPGAADNASGVAALLEIAEQLALSEQRPKRSVCFAAFDREETGLLGSFAFTCREDFQRTKLVAVLNVDVLGREFLDVVHNAVFVLGTEQYPGIRQAVLQTAGEARVRAFPIGTDLAGPSGDHTAFETCAVRCLFFSDGLFADYHRYTDTPDRLDYQLLERSAVLISGTVEQLAESQTTEERVPRRTGDRAELQAIGTVLAEVSAGRDKAGLTPEETKAVEDLTARTDSLLQQSEYSLDDRRRLSWSVAELLSLTERRLLREAGTKQGKGLKPAEAASFDLFWFELYRSHRHTLVELGREFVRHLLEHKPGLFVSMPKFSRQVWEVADDNIAFLDQGEGRHRLSALPVKMSGQGELHFGRGEVSLGVLVQPKDCSGDTGETVDYCLLSWRHDLKDASYARTWAKLLKRVTGQHLGEKYEDWLHWRLAQTDFADEKQWVLALLASPNPQVVREAVPEAAKTAAGEASGALCAMAQDVATPADLRVKAIRALGGGERKRELLVLVELLSDPASSKLRLLDMFGTTLSEEKEHNTFFDASYPFYDHPWMREGRELYAKMASEEGGKKAGGTLADMALTKLKQLTGKDFGKDAKAWRTWVEAHVGSALPAGSPQ